MKAIILAGGKGLRFRPLTDDKPKAMIPVNGKPIASVQLEWLKKCPGITEVVFACGHKWEKLKEFFGDEYLGIPIRYAVETNPLGTGGALRNVLRSTLEEEGKEIVGDAAHNSGTRSDTAANNFNYLVMNGDVITDLPIASMLQTHALNNTIATIALIPYRSPFGVVRIDKLKMVRKFEEKPEFLDAWINGGIYLINGKQVRRFLPEDGDIERETFPQLVERGEISSYPYYGFWRALDSMKDLKTVESELLSISR